MPHYFVYGSALNTPTSVKWNEQRRAPLELGPSQLATLRSQYFLYDVPSTRWNGRIPRRTANPARDLEGRLFEVDDPELWKSIEALEQSHWGTEATRATVAVEVDGESVSAVLWEHPRASQRAAPDAKVSLAFVKALTDGADGSALSLPYLTQLKAEALILEKVQGAVSK